MGQCIAGCCEDHIDAKEQKQRQQCNEIITEDKEYHVIPLPVRPPVKPTNQVKLSRRDIERDRNRDRSNELFTSGVDVNVNVNDESILDEEREKELPKPQTKTVTAIVKELTPEIITTHFPGFIEFKQTSLELPNDLVSIIHAMNAIHPQHTGTILDAVLRAIVNKYKKPTIYNGWVDSTSYLSEKAKMALIGICSRLEDVNELAVEIIMFLNTGMAMYPRIAELLELIGSIGVDQYNDLVAILRKIINPSDDIRTDQYFKMKGITGKPDIISGTTMIEIKCCKRADLEKWKQQLLCYSALLTVTNRPLINRLMIIDLYNNSLYTAWVSISRDQYSDFLKYMVSTK